MAENQSAASEDSGHQQQHQQQQQQQHQQHQQPLATTSVTAASATSTLANQSPTNSQASSPENSQEALPLVRRQQSAAAATVAAAAAATVAATSSNTSQQQRSSISNMFDRTVNAKFKPTASNAGPGNNPGRRNSMLTPARGVSVGGTGGNIRKLTKVNSLTSNHHYSVCYPPSNIYQNSNNSGSNSPLQRTTSESLRLNSLSRVAAATASSVSRASSNSSLATSTSTSLAPKSSSSSGGSNSTPQQQQPVSSSNSSSSTGGSTNNSFTKASSPNNNGARSVGGATATAPAGGSHHHQPHHHHHHHHHHQHHNHQQQQQQQTSLSQGHASLTVAGGSAGGGGGGGGSSGNAGGATNRKPKTTSSFEITSVTVGHPKLNAAGDTGDESADDLDESHTDDNSRITDLENETPSMSEDTFSKEEVYYANNALSTNAPVIPTSSQYGLVVVDPIGPSLGQTIQNVQVNVSDNIINVVSGAVTPGGTKKKDDIKETQHRSERFKVVKIESTEPFKRGRWMCMDYLDHSSVGNGGNNNEKTGSSTSDAHAATADGAAGVAGGSEALPHKTTQSMILPPTQKLNENHLEANSTDANWNYAEQQQQQQQSQQPPQSQQQSSQQQQQQAQISATPSGVMTAPATVVHGMQQLHMEAQQQQQQQLFDSVNANASSPSDSVNMDYARTAAMQLHQTLKQLKEREDAMDVPPGGYPNFQNGGDVGGGAGNNNNTGGAAAGESQLSTSYVEQQQPLSPTPLTPQAPPTFAAVAAGQSPNFQLEQQQQQQQATSQIDGIVPQPFNQQQQQQQTTQQSIPQQTAAAAPSVVAAAPPQQTSNTSNAAVTTGQGQTLPLLSHMTSYEQQQQQPNLGAAATGATGATSVAPQPAIPTLQLQSAPATIADPQQLMVPQQQQQEEQQQQQLTQQQQQQIPPANIASASANNSNLNLTNTNVVATAEATTNALTLTDEQATAAATTAVATGAAAATGATSAAAATQQQIQQLQQQPNAESETESFRTASMIPGASRKRALSNPHIGGPNDPTFVHRLNPQLYYYNKSQSGRSSFCVDESLWPTNNPNGTASESNLYMGSSTEEDYEEAIDQFSPTIYTRSASRAIPIPSSAGNSPQHHPHSQPRIASGIALVAGGGAGGPGGPVPTGAFSASPSIYAYPHSPFYASSPDTSLSSPAQTSGLPGQHPHPGSRISFSYDPAFQRLQVPLISSDRRPRSPLECATVFAAVAAAATCGGAVGGAGGAADTTINSASGTSAVAIDNKIEQAMDLVKSHLMIAVREEVEVLKERISELMDKINKLELENNILKSNIPQETLQQLQMQLQIAAPPATPAIQAAPAVQSAVATAAAGQAVQAGQQQAAGAVTVAVAGVATSPASAVVPTIIPNGSAENGGSAVEQSAAAAEQQQQQQQVTSAAAAAAVTTTNGPMS
ncbi:protein bunched, class 2/F/G isoform isoform X1 [Drosophila subpulchrella]|uniref:protein bunched, class 2/F/G isoform isoform X1 n=1 Tax=Drosophila subpulchrella TaxID=1486046 RepID=UPI0018A16303|nr:protein bunched, class 2/F/G isoform isoform X1 [Drosophila subpulchrella]XP_037708724.1 protein bunched, class 2/F/G isoform isoform X1 [Drosophila subpulchrella]XP_037708725.1 protein bunched, class 2/F/G isoform isoform X1 [Drosophila subpulchrella]